MEAAKQTEKVHRFSHFMDEIQHRMQEQQQRINQMQEQKKSFKNEVSRMKEGAIVLQENVSYYVSKDSASRCLKRKHIRIQNGVLYVFNQDDVRLI